MVLHTYIEDIHTYPLSSEITTKIFKNFLLKIIQLEKVIVITYESPSSFKRWPERGGSE